MGRGLTQMTEYAVPILPSRNLRETLAFYERLGFENRGAPPEEWDYMILGRGGVELHFFAAPDTDPLTTSASCYVFVPDADALHEEWKQVGVPHDGATGSRLGAPMDTDYRMREFALVDRSGNLIRVGSQLRPD
jgi:catechol 2,3-dioxygenase-like lactoylglutathione lyase family enzyme